MGGVFWVFHVNSCDGNLNIWGEGVGGPDVKRTSIRWAQYLSMLKGHQPRVIRGADHFVISPVSGWPPPWGYVVTSQTLRVTNCIILPGTELGAIQGTLQNPVPGSRGISSFDDDIGDLKDLKQRHWKISIKSQWQLFKNQVSLERSPMSPVLLQIAAYKLSVNQKCECSPGGVCFQSKLNKCSQINVYYY